MISGQGAANEKAEMGYNLKQQTKIE